MFETNEKIENISKEIECVKMNQMAILKLNIVIIKLK